MNKTTLIIIGLLCAVISAAGIMHYAPVSTIYRLQVAIEKSNGLLEKYIFELVLQNDQESCVALLGALNPQLDSDSYWIIIKGISRFTDKNALTTMADFIIANKDKIFGPDLLWMMHNNRTPPVLTLLNNVLNNGSYEMQKESLRQISRIPGKESVEIIFDFLKAKPLDSKIYDNRGIIRESISSLRRLLSVDKGFYPDLWLAWWEENKGKDTNELIKPSDYSPSLDIIKCR